MKVNCAYKFELILKPEQRAKCAQFVGNCRYVYNKAVEIQLRQLETKQPFVSYKELASQLVGWKKDDSSLWLSESPAQTLQQALKDLDRGLMRFKQHKGGMVQFKARGDGDSFRLPQLLKGDFDEANARIRIPKIGFVRYRKSRDIQGKVKNLTISIEARRWYVSVCTEIENFQPQATRNGEVGIDLGIVRTVQLSDGTVYRLDVNEIKKLEDRIAVYQKQLESNKTSRQKLAKLGKAADFDKKVPSRKRRRLKEKIANLHRRIRNIRKDFMFKTARAIAQKYGWVAIEALQVRNMTKSARGTIEEPGSNVKAKSGLNRSLQRVAPGAFRRILERQVFKAGGYVDAVAPQYTSQTCPHCGHIASENRPTQALFCCVKCGHTSNADVVAAGNILRKSRAGSDRL